MTTTNNKAARRRCSLNHHKQQKGFKWRTIIRWPIIITTLLLLLMFMLSSYSHAPREQQLSDDILLDRSFDNLKEIVIQHKYGDTYTLVPPTRGRIIIDVDKYGGDEKILRINIVDKNSDLSVQK